MTLHDILGRLDHVQGSGDSYTARCPAHDDRKASLKIDERDGRILLHCFAGCDTERICQALGIQMRDLFTEARAEDKPAPQRGRKPRKPMQPYQVGGVYYNAKIRTEERITQVYTYRSEANEPVLQVARTEAKSFPTCALGSDGHWYAGRGKWGHLLYHLPDVLREKNEKPIYIVEGEKDVESMRAIGLAATTSMGGGGKNKWPAAANEWLRGADIIIIPDNDVPGMDHAQAVARSLSGVAKRVRLIKLRDDMPTLTDKGDFSDWAKIIGSKSEVLRRLNALVDAAGEFTADNGDPRIAAFEGVDGYTVSGGCIAAVNDNGARRLCTFCAAPVREILTDDGVSQEVRYTIRGWAQDGRELDEIRVSAAEFASMRWPMRYWGSQGNIMPGAQTADKLRYAIAEAGRLHAQRQRIYAHTGWRKIGGKWAYLYHGGAVGLDNVAVELTDALSRYRLDGEDIPLSEAQAGSLMLSSALPARVGIPLLALTYLAPLTQALRDAGCPPTFAMFLLGKTGNLKSSVAALALSHWGDFTRATLPSSFHSTANSIRYAAFCLKDALLVVDDFHPSSSPAARKTMTETAQDLARAYGDGASRNRMNADGSQRVSQPPRGLCLISGEDLPEIGASGEARFYIIQLAPGEIQADEVMDEMQRMAKNGVFARAMRGYLGWLGERMDGLTAGLWETFARLRREAGARLPSAHKRAAETVAHLMIGVESMCQWMTDTGGMDGDTAAAYREQAMEILIGQSAEQARESADISPSRMYLRALGELIGTHQVELKVVGDKGEPVNMIGYRDLEHYYISPEAAFSRVCRLYSDQGISFPVSARQLYKNLREEGLITPGSDTPTRTKRIDGRVQRLLWIPRAVLDGKAPTPPARNEQIKMKLAQVDAGEAKEVFGEG